MLTRRSLITEFQRNALFLEDYLRAEVLRPEEIDDPTLDEILKASDQLMGVIYKIRLKRKQKANKRFVI
jgi:hypothetical protein